MFVANVTPVMLIASVAVYNGQAFTAIDTALLIQAAMLIAGIGTLIQLYPVWRIGSACVVTTIGFSLLSTGISFFASSSVYPTGAWQNLLVAGVFVVAMILSLALPKHVKMEDVGALTEDTIENKKPE